MKKITALSMAALLSSTSAMAVQPVTPSFSIWQDSNLSSADKPTDLDGNPVGDIAIVGASNACTDSAPDAAGLLSTNVKSRLQARNNAAPATIEFELILKDTTEKYDRQQTGGIGLCASISSGLIPMNVDYGGGLADTGNTKTPRVVIVGSVFRPRYIGVTAYYVRGTDMAGAILWSKRLLADSDGATIQENLSGVSDFIAQGDGVDELRVVRKKTNPDQSAVFNYYYYNVLTGAQIANKSFTVAAP